jgi:hypothetical protein
MDTTTQSKNPLSAQTSLNPLKGVLYPIQLQLGQGVVVLSIATSARWALPSSLRIHDLFIPICGSFKQNTNCYMFRLDMQRIVYATRIGCMARFLNHCCGVPSPLSLRHGNNFSLVTFRNSNCQLYHTLSLPQRKCRDLQTPQSCGPDLTH